MGSPAGVVYECVVGSERDGDGGVGVGDSAGDVGDQRATK